ncbi:MAG TPA: hypothetical protein VI039_13115 [Solirubrobacterales bacterium]
MHVVDRRGRELRVGSRVALSTVPPAPPSSRQDDGKVRQFTVGTDTCEPGVEVRWPDADTYCFDWYPLDANDACQDLELIDPEEEN